MRDLDEQMNQKYSGLLVRLSAQHVRAPIDLIHKHLTFGFSC